MFHFQNGKCSNVFCFWLWECFRFKPVSQKCEITLISPDNPCFHICSSELHLSNRIFAFRLSSVPVEISIMLGGPLPLKKLRPTPHQGCCSRYQNSMSDVSKRSGYQVLLVFCKSGTDPSVSVWVLWLWRQVSQSFRYKRLYPYGHGIRK